MKSMSTVCVIVLVRGQIIDRIVVGHTAVAPVLSPDETRLYVCNRFDNDISVIDVGSLKVLKSVPVGQAPWGVVSRP